ncbi:hypothetical protein ACQYRI_03810 [Salmonella enterica]
MYDDLGSLAEKLKMSGVSFQQMNEEDGATMQAVTTTAATSDAREEMQEPQLAETPADNRKATSQASVTAEIPANTISWPRSKPVVAQGVISAPASYIQENVIPASRPMETSARERNPVRLDMLFSVIGK